VSAGSRELAGASLKEKSLVSVLFKFEMFLLLLHVGGLCILLAMARSEANCFNAWLISGAFCFYFGAVLFVFAWPEPFHDWEAVLQSLANISLGGVPLPFMLMLAGALLLGNGTRLHLRGKNAR